MRIAYVRISVRPTENNISNKARTNCHVIRKVSKCKVPKFSDEKPSKSKSTYRGNESPIKRKENNEGVCLPMTKRLESKQYPKLAILGTVEALHS